MFSYRSCGKCWTEIAQLRKDMFCMCTVCHSTSTVETHQQVIQTCVNQASLATLTFIFSWKWIHFQGRYFGFPYETVSAKGSTLKANNLGKFFPSRVGLFSKGTWCAEKQNRRHKNDRFSTQWPQVYHVY